MQQHVQLTQRLAMIAGIVVATILAGPATAEEATFNQTISTDSIPPSVTQQCGTITEGTEVVLTVTITNPSTKPFHLGTVQSLCACMTAEPSATTIAPSGSATITLRLETEGYSGPTQESALVQWVDSSVAVTRINLELTVQPVLEVTPRRLVRFRTDAGTAATEEIRIRTPDGSPFALLAVEPSSDILSVSHTEQADGYAISITVSDQAPPGMLRESITVRTDLATMPELVVKVTGVVRSSD